MRGRNPGWFRPFFLCARRGKHIRNTRHTSTARCLMKYIMRERHTRCFIDFRSMRTLIRPSENIWWVLESGFSGWLRLAGGSYAPWWERLWCPYVMHLCAPSAEIRGSRPLHLLLWSLILCILRCRGSGRSMWSWHFLFFWPFIWCIWCWRNSGPVLQPVSLAGKKRWKLRISVYFLSGDACSVVFYP